MVALWSSGLWTNSLRQLTRNGCFFSGFTSVRLVRFTSSITLYRYSTDILPIFHLSERSSSFVVIHHGRDAQLISSIVVCEDSNASLAGDEWASFSQLAMFRSDFSKGLAALHSNRHLVVLDIGYELLGGIGAVVLILGESDHASNLQFSAVVCQDPR